MFDSDLRRQIDGYLLGYNVKMNTITSENRKVYMSGRVSRIAFGWYVTSDVSHDEQDHAHDE